MSLQQPVRRMAAYLPQALASSDSVQQIEKVAEWFPAEISNTFCFEAELTGEPSFIDFAFSCTRGSTGIQILAQKLKPADRLIHGTVWTNISNLCRSLGEGDRSFRDNINHLWLEFDIGKEQGVPIPCLFLAIPEHGTSNIEWLVQIFQILNYPSSPQFFELLTHCFRSPALRNKSFEVGFMFSRQTDKARLVFLDVSEDFINSLEDLGLTCAGPAELRSLLADLKGIAKTINLAIDVGDTIGSKIGLECQFSGKVQSDQPRWSRLLDALVSVGCSARDKRDAVLSWPGSSVERFSHLLWPTAVVRKISHLKVVWQPGNSPLQSKAYLLARYNPDNCSI